MKKNPLFYNKSNANLSKIAYAKKKLMLALLCIFSVVCMTALSIDNSASAKGVVKCSTISLGSLALLPFAAKVKGTKEVNGEDETEEAFKARGDKPESDVDFAKRLILSTVKTEIEKESGERKKELETFRDEVTAAKSSLDVVKKLEEEMRKQGLVIESLKEEGKKSNKSAPIEKQIHKWIEDNAAKIKELRSASSGEIQFKSAASMLSTSISSGETVPVLQGAQVAPPSNINLRASIINGLVSLFPTSQASYAYTESVPKDGNYSFVAEAGSKPLIDFSMVTRYAAPKKAAAYMLLSEESVTDITGLQSIATDYLRKKHDLKKQNGILFGDNAGANPKGATVYGRVFSADGLANKVVAPNLMDVINAAVTDIFTTHNFTDEVPFMANIAMMNPNDFFTELVAAKDSQGHPLYPSASLFNEVILGGVRILPFEDIPTGKIFVADLSKYNTTDYVGYSVRIGWINDNFITNQFCMVGESRFHAFVKNLDTQAFIYDDIDTIKAAIAKQ